MKNNFIYNILKFAILIVFFSSCSDKIFVNSNLTRCSYSNGFYFYSNNELLVVLNLKSKDKFHVEEIIDFSNVKYFINNICSRDLIFDIEENTIQPKVVKPLLSKIKIICDNNDCDKKNQQIFIKKILFINNWKLYKIHGILTFD